MNTKKTFLDFAYVFLGTAFTRGLSFLATIIIARTLGPDDLGKFSLFYLFLILAWRTPQGFDTTFILFAKRTTRFEDKIPFLRATFLLKILYSAAISLLFLFLSTPFFSYFMEKPELGPLILKAVVAGCTLAFLASIAAYFQEQERFKIYGFLNSFFHTASFFLLCLFFFVFNQKSLETAVNIHLFSGLIVGAFSFFYLYRLCGSSLKLEKGQLASSYSLGKWILGVTIVHYVYQRVDLIVLTKFVDYHQLGIYAVAQNLIAMVMLLLSTVSEVFMPKAMVSMHTKEKYFSYLRHTLLPVCLINVFLLCLFLLAPYLIVLLYGPQFSDAILILRVLLAGLAVYSFYIPFSFLFYALDAPKTRFVLDLFGLAVSVIMLFAMIPVWHSAGAAYGKTLSLILCTGISMLVVLGKIKAHFGAALKENHPTPTP